MSIYKISQAGPLLGSQALIPRISLPESPLAIQPAIPPIPTQSVPAYEARYANNAIKSMETTALRNRKHSGGSASSMNILGIMTDYDVDGSHAAASRGPAVRGVR